MTIKECYEMAGSDYGKVVERLGSEALVKRFALKFLTDGSYEKLKDAMERGDGEDAFHGAHTLKGVCLNLGFDILGEVSSKLTESMRENRDTTNGEIYMERISAEYDKLIGLLQQVQ